VDVPEPPGIAFRAPLYFRILPLSSTALRIELWELGRPEGVRSISTLGNENLVARRIALAAAEIARQVRKRRLAGLDRPPGTETESRTTDTHHAGLPIYARFAWSGGVRAATVGAADAWMLGPTVDTTLRWSSGQRLVLGAAWLVGKAPAAEDASLRWLEASLTFAQGLELSPSLALDVGLGAAVASVRLTPEGGTRALDTWSGRAFALARLEGRLGDHAAIGVGPEIGAVLRPIDWAGTTGHDRLAGVWLGGTLTLTVGVEPR